ncbi:DUF6545 domain-containing protein [Nocardia thailandica]
MQGAPAVVVWGCAVWAVVVTVLRLWLVRETAEERLINRALLFAAAGTFLGVASVPLHLGIAGRTVGAVVGFFTSSSVFGFARVVATRDTEGIWRRQRRYDAGAWLLGAISVILGVAAGTGLITVDLLNRWFDLGGVLVCFPLAVSGALILRGCVREIVLPATSLAERITYGILISIAGYWISYSGYLVVLFAMNRSTFAIGPVWALCAYAFLAAITTLLAIPVMWRLLDVLGWNRAGRDCARLRPLWADLTAEVPEVCLGDTIHRNAAERRYRMTIEIRDALLHLRRQAESPDGFAAQPGRACVWRRVYEIEERLGPEDIAAEHGSRDLSPEHERELRYLLAVAGRWPRADEPAVPAAVSAASPG